MRSRLRRIAVGAALVLLLPGCWSSKEIEDLALYAGLAMDTGRPAPAEKTFEAKGAVYNK